MDVISGPHAGIRVETGVEIAELAGWPIAPPHGLHMDATVAFEHTNSQPSPFGWHSRQIADWGSDPIPARPGWLTCVVCWGRLDDLGGSARGSDPDADAHVGGYDS